MRAAISLLDAASTLPNGWEVVEDVFLVGQRDDEALKEGAWLHVPACI
jgi:hypothetical protein